MGSSSPPPGGGAVPDLAICRSMSVNEKIELVRELSKSKLNAPEQLQEWTRREISEVLCAELGRKRKEKTFSSIPKHKMLDILFKVVSGESSCPRKYRKRKSNPELNAFNRPLPFKRQRKNGSSSLFPVMAMARTRALTAVSALTNNAHLCQNSACRATMNPGDKFCKRCSCCICFKYDDNKDPTLWLFCNSDHPSQEDSCGFSCHLECAIEDERSGSQQSGQSKKLDGSHHCTHCGKQNDLLGCLEKQLLVAKNARRLDVLCHRIFLSHKILTSTKKYLVLHDIVDTAMKKLEAEVGPITAIRGMGHGLVGRLAVGAEVQKLCICAIEAIQLLFSGSLTADLQIQTAFDEEQEIPGSNAQADLLRNSSSLTMYSRRTLKQNLDMILTGSEITTCMHSGNILIDSPENSWSLPKQTKNHKGDSGKSFEEANSIEEALRTESEQSQRTETGLVKDNESIRSDLSKRCEDLASVTSLCAIYEGQIKDLDKEAEELNKENELVNQMIDQVTKSSEEENKALKDHVEQLNKEIEHVRQTLEQVKKSSEGEKKALEDQVVQLNQRIEEASRALELEKTIAEKATQERDMLTKELKIREVPEPDFSLSIFTQLQSFAQQIRAEVIKMEKDNPSIDDILGGMDAQIRVLQARILMIENDLENSARDAIECSLGDFLVKIRVLYPDFDVQSLVPELKDGDYRKVRDEVQPVAVELGKNVRLASLKCEGDPGNIFEEVRSGDHVLQNGCLKAETDPRSSSCKKTFRRFLDEGHESGPADPNTPVQTTLHRESSHLMLNSRETFQQNLNADAARLEDASDVPSEYELADSLPCNGSPVPIVENDIKSDKGISAIDSELKADHHTAQTSLLKPETEPESSSKKSLSGKPEAVTRQDGQSEASYKYCIKVIRRLECEGYIESSFRVKFLTWFCLLATPHERRRVTVYVDSLMDDPASLAAKLADTYNKRPHRVPSGF